MACLTILTILCLPNVHFLYHLFDKIIFLHYSFMKIGLIFQLCNYIATEQNLMTIDLKILSTTNWKKKSSNLAFHARVDFPKPSLKSIWYELAIIIRNNKLFNLQIKYLQ